MQRTVAPGRCCSRTSCAGAPRRAQVPAQAPHARRGRRWSPSSGSKWELRARDERRTVIGSGVLTLPPLPASGRWVLEKDGEFDELVVLPSTRASRIRTRGAWEVVPKQERAFRFARDDPPAPVVARSRLDVVVGAGRLLADRRAAPMTARPRWEEAGKGERDPRRAAGPAAGSSRSGCFSSSPRIHGPPMAARGDRPLLTLALAPRVPPPQRGSGDVVVIVDRSRSMPPRRQRAKAHSPVRAPRRPDVASASCPFGRSPRVEMALSADWPLPRLHRGDRRRGLEPRGPRSTPRAISFRPIAAAALLVLSDGRDRLDSRVAARRSRPAASRRCVPSARRLGDRRRGRPLVGAANVAAQEPFLVTCDPQVDRRHPRPR